MSVMVHHQPVYLFYPGMGTFGHPTRWQHHEAPGIRSARKEIALIRETPAAGLGVGRVAHDFDRHGMLLMDRLGAASSIGFSVTSWRRGSSSSSSNFLERLPFDSGSLP